MKKEDLFLSKPKFECFVRGILYLLFVIVVLCLFVFGDVNTNIWNNLIDPNKPITIINITSNTIQCGDIKFFPLSTNDLGLMYSRERINRNIFTIYHYIVIGKLTNIVNGHIPVSNF